MRSLRPNSSSFLNLEKRPSWEKWLMTKILKMLLIRIKTTTRRRIEKILGLPMVWILMILIIRKICMMAFQSKWIKITTLHLVIRVLNLIKVLESKWKVKDQTKNIWQAFRTCVIIKSIMRCKLLANLIL